MTDTHTLYIHVGMPKTGTSAIQKMLANNRQKLASLGYTYPGNLNDHWPFVEGLRVLDGMLTNDLVRPILEEIRESDNHAILSCEGFSDMRSAKMPAHLMEALRAFGITHRVVVILYVRRQDDWLDSGYRQKVKMGLTDTFDEYFNDWRSQDFVLVDYLRKAFDWAAFVGEDNIIVRPYRRDAWVERNLFSDVLSSMGLTALQRESIDIQLDSANPSLSTDVIAAFVLIGKILGRTELNSDDPVFLSSFCYEGSYGDFISPSQRADVLNMLAESNEQLAKTYLELDDPKGLFPSLMTNGVWKPHALDKDDAQRFVDLILTALPKNSFIYSNRILLRLGLAMRYSSVPFIQSLAFSAPGKLTFLSKSPKQHLKSVERFLRKLGRLVRRR
jgi:hypothetical protein